MTAKELIQLAKSKGVSIGRTRPGRYYYGYYIDGRYQQYDFHGTWHDFVAFVKSL